SFPDVLRRSYRFFSTPHPVRVHSSRRSRPCPRTDGPCVAVIREQARSYKAHSQEITMTSYRNGPDARGLFGSFGGQYVAETLMPLIHSLAAEYEKAKNDP